MHKPLPPVLRVGWAVATPGRTAPKTMTPREIVLNKGRTEERIAVPIAARSAGKTVAPSAVKTVAKTAGKQGKSAGTTAKSAESVAKTAPAYNKPIPARSRDAIFRIQQ